MSFSASSPATPPPPQAGETLYQQPSFMAENRQTLLLAFPLIVGQLSQMLIGLSDTVMLGRLGVNELGAATFANTLLIIPLVLGIGLLSSISVRVSQAYGAQDPDGAGEALRHGTWMALAFGILTVIVSVLLVPFLAYFRQPAEVVAVTPVFLVVCAFSLVPALVGMAWKNHADALNRPWPPFWIMMAGVVLDIFLNWVFIWGHLGMPALGIEGAAYSTLVSRIVVAAALFYWLKKSRDVREWTPSRWWVRCKAQVFRSLLAIGFPASLQLLTEVTAFAVCSLLIGTLGAVPLAAHQVAINCAGTTFMIPLGIAMAMTVRVGEIVGAQQRARLHRVLVGGWLFAFVVMTLSMTGFLLAGDWIASLFVRDAGVISIAARLLVIAGLFQLFDGLQVVSALSLRGVNDVRIPAWFAFFAYWVVAIPLGAFLGLGLKWGAEGMWVGLAVGLALAAVALGWRSWRLLGPAYAGPSGKDPDSLEPNPALGS